MVPGIIVVGSFSPEVLRVLEDAGVTVLEPQTSKTEDISRWVSDVQAKQIGKGPRAEVRPPWIRKATGRAPRKLGLKGPRR